MTKVFIGGSRRITRLNAEVRARLDRIIDQGFPAVVGDANGADKAVQQHFLSKNYRNLEVFCSGSQPRNNVGHWPLRTVAVASKKRDRRFFTAKDKVMTQEATVGFMLWDGKSVGTLQNVARLLGQNKTTLVYLAPEREFREIRTQGDWTELLSLCPPDVREKLEDDQVRVPAHAYETAQTSLW